MVDSGENSKVNDIHDTLITIRSNELHVSSTVLEKDGFSKTLRGTLNRTTCCYTVRVR